MPEFALPLSVRDGDRTARLIVRLARPLAWSAVRAAVCRAAGLDETTVLYRGVGAVEDSWIVGCPPLLVGCLLATAPENDVCSHDPLVVTVIAGPDAGRSVPLVGAPIIIGRGSEADLRLDDPAVSTRHAAITPAATGLSVTDLGSTNGVFVDGVRVDDTQAGGPPAAVTGSVIRVGTSVLQIQLTAEPAGAFHADGHGHVVRAGRPARAAATPLVSPPRPVEPDPPPRRSLPVLSAVIGAVIGGGLAIVLHNSLYLAFAAFGPATMIGSALSDRLRGRRSLRRQRRDYRTAVSRWQTARHAAVVAFRRSAWQEWPGPAELLRRAETGSARLWAMAGPELTVSVGSGRLAPPIDTPRKVDVPGIEPGPTQRPSDQVLDVPVTITMTGVMGFVGAAERGLARYVIAQLACNYSPGTAAVAVISDRDDLAACRELPHARQWGDALDVLADVPRPDQGRHVVVVLDGATAIHGAHGAAALRAAGETVTVLCLAETPQSLPPQAVAVTAAAVRPSLLTSTHATGELLQRVCRALAPLRDEQAAAATALPEAMDLTGLTGPLDADRLRRRWQAGSVRAVLGYGDGGALSLDLDADGPHLLIAGTTGSGKSELLQTIIASLAANASPRAVTFLLVDYKGGAAFGAITELPHVVGVLTDLDPAASSRALASLRAELRRRERLEAAGAPRPAKLVVVIDEFATLAAELPEFLAGMVDVAQRGRSLGLHLIVATQRPAGVVSPAMRANISARICLRVTDPAESLDVIAIPDAASLPPSRPGRAIARLSGITTTFQTARVSVPAPPEVTVIADPKYDTSAAASVPDRERAFTSRRAGQTGPAPTILRAIIDASRSAASGMPAADRPWLPPLSAHITPAEVAPTTLAVADLPERQRRDELPAPQASTLVLGPPQSGRSTALRRIAALAADRGEELIVFDGAASLADLAAWGAVSTYLTVREPRLVMRALTLLSDPARRPGDGHLRHVVIDHLDLVSAELERTDYATGGALLAELLTRGAETVRISGSGPDRIRHQRIAAGFREVIELAAAAPSTPGRGTWSGRVVQLVDAAAAPAPARTAPQRDAVVVRRLPDAVSLAQLPAPRPDFVTFAVGGDAALPLAADLTGPGGGLVIAGPRRSGVTNALAVWARQAARAGIPTLWVAVDPVAGAPDLPGVTIIACQAGTDALTAALRSHHGPILLVADHGGLGDDHPAAELFQRFLAVCGPGQHLLTGARTDALMRSRHGHLHAAASYRRGVLLAPDQADGPLLDLTLPRRSGPVTAGRGIWTWDGDTVAAHIAVAGNAVGERRPDAVSSAVNGLTPEVVDSSSIER